jgi:hypothetical protein
MTDEFRELYRTVTGACVTNGMMAFHVPETHYRAFGYQPNFDCLPYTYAPTGRIYSIRSLFAAWQDRVVATSVPKREREQ